MKKALYLIITIAVFQVNLGAQVFNTSIGFGYDALVESEGFPVVALGVEGAGGGRWSVSGGFNFGSTSNGSINSVLVDRSHYTFESNANFYFRRVLQGLFISGGGFYGVNKADPVGQGDIPSYLRREEQAGLQFGLGFSQQFTPELNMALVTRMGKDFYGGEDARLYFGFSLGYNWLGGE